VNRIILIASILAACTSSPAIPRDRACHEQADAWCARAGFMGSPGCMLWYVHECEPNGPDGLIDAESQDACMAAIEDSKDPGIEPSECRATWRTSAP
jgi:hypothetical protein